MTDILIKKIMESIFGWQPVYFQYLIVPKNKKYDYY